MTEHIRIAKCSGSVILHDKDSGIEERRIIVSDPEQTLISPVRPPAVHDQVRAGVPGILRLLRIVPAYDRDGMIGGRLGSTLLPAGIIRIQIRIVISHAGIVGRHNASVCVYRALDLVGDRIPGLCFPPGIL